MTRVPAKTDSKTMTGIKTMVGVGPETKTMVRVRAKTVLTFPPCHACRAPVAHDMTGPPVKRLSSACRESARQTGGAA